MKTALKIFGVLILVLVLVVSGLVLALPHLLSTDVVQTRIAKLVKQKTGRDLDIAGDTSFKLFPNIAVSLDDVTLSNPPGMSGAPLVKVKSLRTNLKLMPLLKGQAEIDSVTLIEPRINLLVDQAGNRNWDIKTPDSKTSKERTTKTTGVRKKSAEKKLSLGKVTIKDGFVRYTNAKDGIDETVDMINLALEQKMPDRSFITKGYLRWHEEKLNITSMVSEPDKLIDGKPSDFLVSLKFALADMELVGLFSPEPVSFDGFVKADTPSVRRLAAFFGKELPAGKGFGPLKFNSHVKGNQENVSFTTDYLQFDGMNIFAKGSFKQQQPRPYASANIEIDRLNLNQYIEEEQNKTANTANKSGGAVSSGGVSGSQRSPKKESDTPVDLSGLRIIDGDFSLKSKQTLFKKAELGEGHFKVTMNNGRANASIEKLLLYRGAASGKFVLDGSGSRSFIGGNIALTDVLTGALLRDFAGFDKLAGKGNIKGDFTASGNSVNALTKTLAGTAKLKLLEGRIEGFDLAKYVSDLTGNKIPGSSQSTNDKPMTAYDQMSGLITINNGIARNQDFLFLGKFFRVRASGKVDLVKKTLRLRVAPKLFSGNWNFAPPLKVTGPWSDPKVKLDALAFLGGGGSVVRSLTGVLRGEKLDLGDVLKKRGLQTDGEIETYLSGKKVDPGTNENKSGENSGSFDDLVEGALGGDKNKDAKKLLKGLFQ